MSDKTKTLIVTVTGNLKKAIDDVHGQLDVRDDVLDTMTTPEVARQLLKWAVVEHRAGRGPWQKR